MNDYDIDILNKYNSQLLNELKINEVNVKEKALRVPSLKHFWANQLIINKRKLQKMQKQRKALQQQVSKQVIQKTSPVLLSDSAIDSAINASDILDNINSQIDDVQIIIEYLERVEKIMSSLTWDVKNIADLIKLETQ